MIQEMDARRPALKTEEAALLPAVSRNPWGSAALKAARDAAEGIKAKKTAPVAAQASAAPRENRPAPPRRAALYHALRNG